jgi:hypothetical protein
MKVIYLFLCNIFTQTHLTFAIHDTFIRNVDKPPCIKCKHYLPDPNDRFVSSTAKCNMFGGKDTHTGIVLYEEARSVRRDEVRCSDAGTYFEEERNLFIKQTGHMIRQTGPTVVFTLFCILLLQGI